jgi:hypothetical protein
MTDDLLTDIDPNTNYLEQLVGDGKKFKTPEELAKGKHESDLYINTLTQRMDELRDDYARLREDYNSRAKLEEVLDQYKTDKLSGSNNEPLAKEVVNTPALKPEDISAMFATEMQKQKQLEREDANFKVVQAKLRERFGSNREALKQHLDDLDLSEDAVRDLAKRNPKVVLRTLGLDDSRPSNDFLAPPRSVQRSDNFAPKTTKRTWSWYQDLKVKDPVKYASKETTLQMHKDYQEQGPAFEDGDFYDNKYNPARRF